MGKLRETAVRRSSHSGSILKLTAVLVAATLLSACVEETAPQLTAAAPQQAAPAITPRPGVSPAGAPIAFVSLAGAPDSARKLLGDAMTSALITRQVKLAGQESAKYLVQGHLIAVPGEKSTAFSWIWDIYGADRQRRHRLEDGVTIPAAAADPWSLFSDKVAAEIANKSAQELAAYLTHTPEAIAAAKSAPAGSPAPRVPAATATVATGPANTGLPGSGPALGYSPLR